MNTIRCSMLPAWDDCARRTGGRQFAALLEKRGHRMRDLLPSVGSAIGTAVHRGAAHLLIARVASAQEPSEHECMEAAEASLVDALKPGAVWDATTPNMQTALAQLHRMLGVYLPWLHGVTPLVVEERLRAGVTDGWELSGHCDLLTATHHLDDLKTGNIPRSYGAQLGGYILDLEANGYTPRKASMTYVARVRLRSKGGSAKAQPGPVRTEYDILEAKRSAWTAIRDIVRSVNAFERTGDPHELRANPMSLMCSPKYCAAWGTQFCRQHRGATPDQGLEQMETA